MKSFIHKLTPAHKSYSNELINQLAVCVCVHVITHLESLPREATGNQRHLCSAFQSQLVFWSSIYHPVCMVCVYVKLGTNCLHTMCVYVLKISGCRS